MIIRYENEIKELEEEVIRLVIRRDNNEISHSLMVSLQWLIRNEIHRLKTLIELFKGDLK